ncbi:unnamed protein product [Enterobius vermicularis]|uniref:Ion_trans_2 domain-containing protein n=1 Tax=Enterobius vermicularis TaxID=51028 RepID=A0A0N4UXC1_ENTVE|nr:unnamed protein product [Enterobius vermicularis]
MFDLYQRFRSLNKRFRLDSALPFIALVSYTIAGAALFRALELEKDRSEREHFRRTALSILAINSASSFDISHAKYSEDLQRAVERIQWLFNYLNLTHTINEKTEPTPWSWYGSMFYAGQLYTTIGFQTTKQTRAGQIASIFYILAGIPIFLIILKNVGILLSKFFRKLYKRIRSARRKLVPVKVKYINLKIYFSYFECSGSLKSKTDAFPITIAFAILILWIILSAALFCLWEKQWGFLTSVYFFFVSISTVGLGDVVPSNKDMMLANFVLILFGLALLSMCFNVIQHIFKLQLRIPVESITSKKKKSLLFKIMSFLKKILIYL